MDNAYEEPSTPTAGAWWALMEEDDQLFEPHSPTSPNAQQYKQSGFWSKFLLPESPSDELTAASYYDSTPVSNNNHNQQQRTRLPNHTTATASNGSVVKADFLANLWQCGALQTTTPTATNSWNKQSEEDTLTLEQRIDKGINAAVDRISPCNDKSLSDKQHRVLIDATESDTYYELSSASDTDEEEEEDVEEENDTAGRITASSTPESDNVLVDLQRQLPYLRERCSTVASSSKYKDLLGGGEGGGGGGGSGVSGAGVKLSNSRQAPSVPTNATLQIWKNHKKKTESSARKTERRQQTSPSKKKIATVTHTRRKFPVENTIDTKLAAPPPKAVVSPTHGDVVRASKQQRQQQKQKKKPPSILKTRTQQPQEQRHQSLEKIHTTTTGTSFKSKWAHMRNSPAKTLKVSNVNKPFTISDKNNNDTKTPATKTKTADNTNKNAPFETIVIKDTTATNVKATLAAVDEDAVLVERVSTLTATTADEHSQHKPQDDHHQSEECPHDPHSQGVDALMMTMGDGTKMCMPPLLLKKIKHLKLAKSGSSSQSVPTAIFGLQQHQQPIGASSSHNNSDDEPYVYEYNSNSHAYIAFFRRGDKATQSIRLYGQPIPAAFPILEQEVVVQIDASTVSMTDCHVRRGKYWGETSRSHALNLPIVPGVTFSGRVHQMGKSGHRTGLKEGDRVVSLVQVGANSSHLCIPSDRLVKCPDELHNPRLEACMPEIYLTAFQALHLGQKNAARYRRTSLSGKTILVLGGATAQGRALIELAKAAGCETVYATGKDKQFLGIRQAGGAPLGRDPLQWSSILARKVDIVVGIDNSIGKSELKKEHLELLCRNGRVVLLCAPDREEKDVVELDELAEITENTGRKLYHYNVFEAWEEDLKQGKRDLTHLLKLLADGFLQPQIIERIPLTKVAKAQDLMEDKKVSGFILCEPWMKGKRRAYIPGTTVFAESASKSTGDVTPPEAALEVITDENKQTAALPQETVAAGTTIKSSPTKNFYNAIPPLQQRFDGI